MSILVVGNAGHTVRDLAAGSILVSALVGCGSGGAPPGNTPFLVKDIAAGQSSSSPSQFTLSGRFAYFAASDPAHGRELWRTDGTSAGTVLLKDIDPGPSGRASLFELTDVNGVLFFTAIDAEHGDELWRSDGTEAGTFLVSDVNPGPQLSQPTRGSSFPSSLTNVNGRLFFVGCDEETGNELWTSDGSEAGTRMVKDIIPGPGIPPNPAGSPRSACRDSPSPSMLTAMNGIVYFFVTLPELGREVWRSDGTAEGTYLVKDAHPGPDPATFPSMGDVAPPQRMAVVKDQLFFPSRSELWKTDGTAAGTVPVATGTGTPWLLTASRDYAFFAGTGGLWRTDGTQVGTMLLKPLHFGLSARFDGRLSDMQGTANGVFFDASTDGVGYEPWFSSGTAEGTRLIEDIKPGSPSSSPRSAVWLGGSVYFFADDAEHGWQLWRARDSAAEVHRLTDLANTFESTVGAGPSMVVFRGGDGDHGQELWAFRPAAGG